jgi:hypothetical protein
MLQMCKAIKHVTVKLREVKNPFKNFNNQKVECSKGLRTFGEICCLNRQFDGYVPLVVFTWTWYSWILSLYFIAVSQISSQSHYRISFRSGYEHKLMHGNIFNFMNFLLFSIDTMMTFLSLSS